MVCLRRNDVADMAKTVIEGFKALVGITIEVTKEDGKVYAKLTLPDGNWLNFVGDTEDEALGKLDAIGVIREVAREIRGLAHPHYTYIATEKCVREPTMDTGGISGEQEEAQRKLRELFRAKDDAGFMGVNCLAPVITSASAFPMMCNCILAMEPPAAKVDEYGLDSFMMHHMGV